MRGVAQCPPRPAAPKASLPAGSACSGTSALLKGLTSAPDQRSAGNSCSTLRSRPHAPAALASAPGLPPAKRTPF